MERMLLRKHRPFKAAPILRSGAACPVRHATVRRIMETAYLIEEVIMATTIRKTAYCST